MTAAAQKKCEILEFIRTHPGCSGQELHAGVTGGKTVVGTAVQRLRVDKLVENRGDSGLGANWYLVEIGKTVDSAYFELAEDLLRGMKTVHHTQRKAYLAERLEELMTL